MDGWNGIALQVHVPRRLRPNKSGADIHHKAVSQVELRYQRNRFLSYAI